MTEEMQGCARVTGTVTSDKANEQASTPTDEKRR